MLQGLGLIHDPALTTCYAPSSCTPCLQPLLQGLGLTHDPGSLGGIHRGNLNVLWFNIGRQQVRRTWPISHASWLLLLFTA
jgi:hypothetical protein